jgi:hypothetical protein
MRKILCILVILALAIPAVSMAEACKTKPADPADPVTLPVIDPQIIDAAMKNLATAIATNNCTVIGSALGAAEEQLATAIQAGGIGDVKAKVKVDLEHQKAMATLKIKAKGQSYNGVALNKLTIKAKVKQASDGLYHADIKINGRFTEQQKAYLLSIFQKYQGQVPGIVVNFRIC